LTRSVVGAVSATRRTLQISPSACPVKAACRLTWRTPALAFEIAADYFPGRLSQHGRSGKKYLPFVGGARRSTSGGPVFAMSERTSQLITICMLISALAMVGWVMSGTL